MKPSLVERAAAQRLEEELARPVFALPRDKYERKEKYGTVRIRSLGIRRRYAPRGHNTCLKCDEFAERGISYCMQHAIETAACRGSKLYHFKLARGL